MFACVLCFVLFLYVLFSAQRPNKTERIGKKAWSGGGMGTFGDSHTHTAAGSLKSQTRRKCFQTVLISKLICEPVSFLLVVRKTGSNYLQAALKRPRR